MEGMRDKLILILCLTTPTKSSIQTNISMITTSTVMLCFLSKFTRKLPTRENYSLSPSGGVSECNNLEDGCTMKFTNLSLTSCFSDEPKAPILKLANHLLISSLLPIASGDYLDSNWFCISTHHYSSLL